MSYEIRYRQFVNFIHNAYNGITYYVATIECDSCVSGWKHTETFVAHSMSQSFWHQDLHVTNCHGTKRGFVQPHTPRNGNKFLSADSTHFNDGCLNSVKLSYVEDIMEDMNKTKRHFTTLGQIMIAFSYMKSFRKQSNQNYPGKAVPKF